MVHVAWRRILPVLNPLTIGSFFTALLIFIALHVLVFVLATDMPIYISHFIYTPLWWVLLAMFSSLAAVTFLLGIHFAMQTRFRGHRFVLACGMFLASLASVLLAIFPASNNPDYTSIYGRIHEVAAISLFIILFGTLSWLIMYRFLQRGPSLFGVFIGLLLLASIGLLVWLLYGFITGDESVGWAQRLSVLWLASGFSFVQSDILVR